MTHGLSRCPLLKKYEVTDNETNSGHPKADWAKEICFDYCPVKRCVDSYRQPISRVDRIKLEAIEVPLKVRNELICRKCGGQVKVLDKDEKVIKCLQCSKAYNIPFSYEK